MLPSVLDCKCSVEDMPSQCELVSVTAMHRRCSDRVLYAHYCVLQLVLTASIQCQDTKAVLSDDDATANVDRLIDLSR